MSARVAEDQLKESKEQRTERSKEQAGRVSWNVAIFCRRCPKGRSSTHTRTKGLEQVGVAPGAVWCGARKDAEAIGLCAGERQGAGDRGKDGAREARHPAPLEAAAPLLRSHQVQVLTPCVQHRAVPRPPGRCLDLGEEATLG